MKSFISLDFEGSGKDPRRHAPTQLGLALFEGDEVVSTLETLIGPPRHYKTNAINREYDSVALELTGFTMKQLLEAPSPAEVCSMVRSWVREHAIGNLPLVAYNAGGYDWPMMRELAYLGGYYDQRARRREPASLGLSHRWVCAQELARAKIEPEEVEAYSLDQVAKVLGLDGRTTELHGALEDAILAGRVLRALSKPRELSGTLLEEAEVVA
jgi:DNA polymerase III epsilon subunit-like protein